jgi:hypothetical protein
MTMLFEACAVRQKCVHRHDKVSGQFVECCDCPGVRSWLQVTAVDIDPSKEQEAKNLGAGK